MWEVALTSDKYIHNKFLGDGFGFLRVDFENGLAMMMGQASANEGDLEQEQFLLDGDFHSGPVSAIRFVGIVGLILFLILIIKTSFYAVDVIKISMGTNYQTCALFFGIPAILSPFVYIFVFGDYRTDLFITLFSIGIMKLLEGSIKDSNRSMMNLQ